MGRKGGENRIATKVRKSVPKQWEPQGSSKELSFGELGSLRSRGVGRCGTPKESISYGSLELKINLKVGLFR